MKLITTYSVVASWINKIRVVIPHSKLDLNLMNIREKTRQESSMILSASPQSRPAGSDCRLVLKFWDGRTDGPTATLYENKDHYRPGLWSALWINIILLKLTV